MGKTGVLKVGLRSCAGSGKQGAEFEAWSDFCEWDDRQPRKLVSATCLPKTGEETGSSARNLDRLLDRVRNPSRKKPCLTLKTCLWARFLQTGCQDLQENQGSRLFFWTCGYLINKTNLKKTSFRKHRWKDAHFLNKNKIKSKLAFWIEDPKRRKILIW